MSDSDGWEITDDQERARKGPKADATLSKFFKAGKYMRKCKRKDHKCLKCDWFVPAARAHNGVLRNHLLHDCPNMSPLERMQVRADNADKMVTGREVQSMLSQPSKKQKQADIRSMIADSPMIADDHAAVARRAQRCERVLAALFRDGAAGRGGHPAAPACAARAAPWRVCDVDRGRL